MSSAAAARFDQCLTRTLPQLATAMSHARSYTALVLTGSPLAHAAAVLTQWQACAAQDACLHLVFFDACETPPAQRGQPTTVQDELAGLMAAQDEQGMPLLPGVHRFDGRLAHYTVTRLIGPLRTTFGQLVARLDLALIDMAGPLQAVANYPDCLLRMAAANFSLLAPPPVATAVSGAIQAKGAKDLKLMDAGDGWSWLAARLHRPASPAPAADARTAWVVGGGLAGAGVAHALALRGWRVHVADPALAADRAGPHEGHLAAALTPLISVDDNFKARLSRAGVYRARQRWAHLGPEIIPARAGTLELARTKGLARDLLQAVQAMGFPEAWVSPVEPGQSAAVSGLAAVRAGAWFHAGMTVAPGQLIRHLLSHPAIVCHGHAVDTLTRSDGQWQLRDRGAVVATCGTVVLAAAMATPQILASSGLQRRRLRSGGLQEALPQIMSMDGLAGEVMHVPQEMLPQQPVMTIGAEGYFLPPVQGRCVLGSTYARHLAEPRVSRQGQSQIIDKLAPALAPGALAGLRARLEAGAPGQGLEAVLPGWAGTRAVLRGRLPAFGPLTHAPGVWVACGYASHGLTWSPLAGDVIAAMLNDEPVPLERELLHAVMPR